MRLDLEVDRIGAPDTEGHGPGSLFRASLASSRSGRLSNAYAQVRDALMKRHPEVELDHVGSIAEQDAACVIMLATFASRLGATNLAYFELTRLRPMELSPYYRAVLHDRLQVQFRRRGELDRAANSGDEAISIAERERFSDLVAPFRENRALTFVASGEFARAIQCHQDAIANYSENHPKSDRIHAFMRLGETYIASGRRASARRVLTVARRDAHAEGLSRTESQCLCLIGDVAWESKQYDNARILWKEAAALLRGYHDVRLRFALDVRLFRLALHVRDAPSSRALRRRLTRTLPAVAVDLPEVAEFLRLESETGSVSGLERAP